MQQLGSQKGKKCQNFVLFIIYSVYFVGEAILIHIYLSRAAYVEFMRKEAADNALSLDNTSFMSRILKVFITFWFSQVIYMFSPSQLYI